MMSDIAVDCIKKDLDKAYGMVVDNLKCVIADMQLLQEAFEQARAGNHMEGTAICYTYHLAIVDSYRSRITILEQLLEEIDFERKLEFTSCSTPLKAWRKAHPS